MTGLSTVTEPLPERTAPSPATTFTLETYEPNELMRTRTRTEPLLSVRTVWKPPETTPGLLV